MFAHQLTLDDLPPVFAEVEDFPFDFAFVFGCKSPKVGGALNDTDISGDVVEAMSLLVL